MACVGCVMGETRAGSAAASVGAFVPVSRVVIDGEERCWQSYKSFGDIALVSLSGGDWNSV